MHITLRMTIMLSIVGALKKEGGDSRTVDFDGKVENPWLEAKTKKVPELVVLKTEINSFWEVHNSSTNSSRQPNHLLCWTSCEERLPRGDDHIPLISFVYHF